MKNGDKISRIHQDVATLRCQFTWMLFSNFQFSISYERKLEKN